MDRLGLSVTMLEILGLITAVTVSLLTGFWIRGSRLTIQPKRYRQEPTRDTDWVLAQVDEISRDVDQHKLLAKRIGEELHALESGDSPDSDDAISRLIESNERMHAQLESAEVRLQEQAREIADHSLAARTDPLTQLANRRSFGDAMASAHRAFVDRHSPTTVMMLDIDHFKKINDNYGHQAGDQVLQRVAASLRESIPDKQLVCRYGGEEFAVIFRHSNLEDIVSIADAARAAIKATSIDYSGLLLSTSVSVGLAQFQAADSVSSLIGRADEALYTSKSAGRNCGHLHDGTNIISFNDWPVGADTLVDASEGPWEMDDSLSTPEVFCHDIRRRLSDFRDGVAPLTVLFVQVDEIHSVEPDVGVRQITQAALRATSLTIKASMREMDHAAKFEQGTLSILLPGSTLAGALIVAERLHAAIARCVLPARFGRQHFTVSIGVAEAMEDEDDDQLIDRVRQSMTAARRYGDDCTFIHDGVECRLIRTGQMTLVES